eukprot:3263019-Pyramimonas_sp.AAC.1
MAKIPTMNGSDAMIAALDGAAGSSERSRQRLFIEFCCGPNSRLGNQALMPDGQCKVVRLTEKEDMTTKEGKAFAVAKIIELEKEFRCEGLATDRRITLWISIPCTGGPPWQYVNEAMYYRSGNEKALKQLRGHGALLRKLLRIARDLAQE